MTYIAKCRLALLVGTTIPLCAGVASAQAAAPALQTAADPQADQTARSTQDATADDIVVTGTRRSLEDALQTKRNSTEIMDTISAEGIGKLPDLNLAESLQRLPGVQINRSSIRRGGTVSIRGLPGDFSQTLINGQYLASPDVSNFQFGFVRAEVFSGIDVQKAINAESLTGGLSGLVNLRTGSPLDSKNQLSVTVDTKYEGLKKGLAPGGAIVFSRQLIPGTLAVRAALGYTRLNFREDNAQINTYDRIAGAATTDLSDDVYAPRQARLVTNVTTGDSYSGSAAVDWKPTQTLKASVSLFYNDYQPSAYSSQFTIEARPTSVRTALDTINEGAFGQTQDRTRVTNPLLIVDSRFTDERLRTGALTGTLAWKNDGWAVDGVVHYTKAKRSLVNFGYQAQQQANATGSNGLSYDLYTGIGNLGQFRYDLLTGSPRLDLGQPFGPVTTAPYRQINATANALQNIIGGFRNHYEEENELAFELNVERELHFGPISSVKVGGIYRDKFQNQSDALQNLYGANLSGLNNSLYNYSFLTGGSAFLDGKIGFFDPGDYAELDVRRITALITPINATNLPTNVSVGPGGLAQFVDSTSISQIYDNKQRIYGGYGQVKLDQELAGWLKVRGNLGVRYERSERATVARTTIPNTSTIIPTNSSFSYGNWLPTANLVFEAGGNLVLRGAYNKTLRRPQVDSFAVLRSVAVDGTGGLVTVNLGASDLKPFTSDNFDLSLEWYNRVGSSISLALFKKNVHDYAGTTRVCPEDGGGFGFGPLTMTSGVCRTVNSTPAGNGFPTVVAGATTNINVTANQSDFTLKGFEVSVQQNLSFLPAPWNGFGGQVNYTYIDFSTASTFRLSEISKNTVNAILYYETKAFGIRAAYNYRSSYFLGSGGTVSGADRFVRARPQLDLSAQLNFNDHLSAHAEVFNLTNEVLYEYEGPETRARNYTVYGRTFSGGFTYRF